jgi:hypothetical protein
MKTFHRVVLLTITLISFAGCKPAEPDALPAPVPEATTATVPAEADSAVDATAVVENTPASDTAAFDSKALAGTFGDGESSLELRADGSYLQTLQAGGSTITADGSWSAVNSTELLLDPNSKSAEDARFVIVSPDELRAADGSRTFRRATGQ